MALPSEVSTSRNEAVRSVSLVISLLTSVLLFGLDNTVTASSQAVIVRQFRAVGKISWFAIAYLAGAAGTNLFWGQLYGRLNVKWLFISTFILFEVGSIICGSAQNVDAFIVGRAICGVGGAGMYVGLSIIISNRIRPEQRPLYFSFIGLSRSLGTVLGPIIGGALASHGDDWRWAFYLNPLIGAPCLLIYLAIIPPFKQERELSLWQRILGTDIMGTTLLCGSLVSFLMAVAFGGTMYSWNNGRIVALFVISGALLVCFLLQQKYRILTRHPSFPLHFLKQPVMMSLFISTACSTASIFVPVYFIPLYYQFVHDDSALQAGVRLLPYIAFNVATLVTNGIIMGKKPYYMPWYLIGGCFAVAGSAALYTINATTSNAKIYGYSILLGIGGGAYSQLAFSAIQTKIDKTLVPTALAFCAFAQLLGPAFALSISSAVFLSRATIGISSLSPSTSKKAIQEVISGASQSMNIPGISPALQQKAIDVIVAALRKVFLLPLSAGALTIIMALFLQRERLFAPVESGNTKPDSSSPSSKGSVAAQDEGEKM